MPESKNIPNTTTFSKIGTSINIFTEYLDTSLPNIIKAFIAQIIGNQDGVPYQEGELVIQGKNAPVEIDYTINDNGELIIIGDSCELKGYSIVDGDLIYTG